VLAQDAERIAQITAALTDDADAEKSPHRLQRVLEAVLVAANDNLFAVCFWFVVLGPVGALLYRLAAELRIPRNSRAVDYTGAAERLHDILNWAPARLFALGFALSGSLTHALEAWQPRRTLNFYENDNLIRAAGLGAMLFTPSASPLAPEEESHWVDEVRGLVGRTFLVWLTMLALITLSGIR
jgi:membrane protein required for beta-lactamase induction